MNGKHTIELDDYEVANLRSLLQAVTVGCPEGKRQPLQSINNGDWYGQILYKLPEVDWKPNMTPEEMAKRAQEWI